MRLATIRLSGAEIAGVVTKKGVLPLRAVNTAKGTAREETMYDLIRADNIRELTDWYNNGGREECESIYFLIVM